MPTSRHTQSTFASGEFDPLLDDREDVSFYYSSAKLLDNVVVLPQSLCKRREGLPVKGLQRGALEAVDITGYTFGAPNGGTAGNLDSTSSGATLLTTGTIGTDTVYVVATLDAGSAVRVSLVDFSARLVGGTITTGTLALQSSDDDVTYTTRASAAIGNTFFARRWAEAPNTDLGTHRYWRVAFLNPDADDYSTDEVEIFGFAFWQEDGYSQSGAEPGEVRIERITATPTNEFWCVMTAGNADIWTVGGGWQAAVPIPHADDEIPWIRTSQNRDTLLLYQVDNPVHQIQRLGADSEWRGDPFAFRTVAQFPFPDSTTGGQNEQQEINFSNMSAGNRFAFELNGEISDEVAWSATAATNITNITNALEGLDGIQSVTVTNPSGNAYLIEWDGADAKTFFPIIIVDILSGSGLAPISRKQYGKPDQEDLWSPTRGYPACGTFYQGGHYMGGFKGQPDVLVRSRLQNFDDFKGDQDPVASSPLILQPDIDDLVEIRAIYPGRSLQIFTSSAELYAPDEPITPDNAALKVTSRRGHQDRTQPVDVQGGTFFVDRNGTALREYLFSEAEQSYTAEPISTLGGHLVQQPIDLALRRGVDTDEPTLVYLVNQGRDRDFTKVPAACLTVDRAQQIAAMTRITTKLGDFKGVAASQGGRVAFMVERRLAGNRWHYLEELDDNHMSDHAVEVANPDLETFTATEDQTVFTYTFSNPVDELDIGVFSRADDLDVWRRVEPDDYTLDTGAKTVTFDTGRDVDTKVAIAKRATSFSTGAPQLDGIECYLHVDGRANGAHTPSSGSVTVLGDEGFFFHARLGLRMVPNVVLHAFKGQGGQSPTMQKQRLFRALINVERTSSLAVCMDGQTPKAVALTSLDSGTYDMDLEEVLYSGQVRISGLGRWQKEPRLRITQNEPGPFLLRAARYDIRF